MIRWVGEALFSDFGMPGHKNKHYIKIHNLVCTYVSLPRTNEQTISPSKKMQRRTTKKAGWTLLGLLTCWIIRWSTCPLECHLASIMKGYSNKTTVLFRASHFFASRTTGGEHTQARLHTFAKPHIYGHSPQAFRQDTLGISTLIKRARPKG